MKIYCRWLSFCAAIALLNLTVQTVKAQAPVVSVTTTNSIIAQTNSESIATNTSFTIASTPGGPLTVNFTLNGTASGGSGYPASYTAGSVGSVVLAAGQISTNINISAVIDSIPRPTTALTLTLQSGAGYSVGTPASASISILNTAPDEFFAAAGAATSMYKAFSNDYTTIIITRWGDTNTEVGAITPGISNFDLSGTAVEGTDFTPPSPVTFNPGDSAQTSYLYPLVAGQLPTDSTNVPYTGNKTIIVNMASASGFSGSTNTAVLTIVDNANPPATTLYSDPLESVADSNNWKVTSANDNMQGYPIDDSIVFAYDLYDDPLDPVTLEGFGLAATPLPFPPNGATNALRMTVNKQYSQYNSFGGYPAGDQGAAGAVNMYLTNAAFSGNFAIRFNMNLVEGFDSYDTVEGALFGFNHSGTATNWFPGSQIQSGWGSGNSTNWASDGIWCWVSVDDGYGPFNGGPSDYMVFTDNGGTLPNTGFQVSPIAQVSETNFANNFKSSVFTSPQGPGLAANVSPDNAQDSLVDDTSWSDVELKQFNNIVTVSIDKTPICVYTNTTTFTNGYLMLGYEDPYDPIGGGDGAVYYSNLRVVRLSPPVMTEAALNAGTYIFDFTSTDGDATSASFQIVGSTSVTGSYTPVPGATITQLSNGAYQATVPTSGPINFYKIQQTL
jgi:hypothetical protein